MGKVTENKAELLQMAQEGKPKPRNSKFVDEHERYLAARLNNYTSPTDWTYDQAFTDQIIATGAGWLTARRLPTLNWFRRQVDDLGFAEEADDDPSLRAAIILLVGVYVGQNEAQMVSITGYPEAQVRGFADNFRQAKIWRDDGKTHVEWGDPDADTQLNMTAFMCDAMVGSGLLSKSYEGDKLPG